MNLTRDKYWYGRLLNMILLRSVPPTVELVIHAEAFAILETFNGPVCEPEMLLMLPEFILFLKQATCTWQNTA